MGATTALATTLANQAFAEAKQGGRFRCGLGHGATSDSLDPATFLDLYMQTVNASSRNNLTEIAQDGSLIPRNWPEGIDTADAMTWKFTLRQGVTFHNGKTMDANDVVASLNHHRGEDSKSPAKELLKAVVDMQSDGANAVVITLKRGQRRLPGRLERLPHTDHAGGRPTGWTGSPAPAPAPTCSRASSPACAPR